MKHPRNRGTGDLRRATGYGNQYRHRYLRDPVFLDRYSRMTGDQKETLRVLLPGWTGTLTELAETVEEIA